MKDAPSPVTEEYWSQWIDHGGHWRGLPDKDRNAILTMPLLVHTDDHLRPSFNKEKVEQRPEILRFKPAGVGSSGWLVVCRLMQVYHSAGPVFSPPFDAQKHADFLGKHVFCEAAGREFHRGCYNRYSWEPRKLVIDPSRFGSLRRLVDFLKIPTGESGQAWEKFWSQADRTDDIPKLFTGQQVTACAKRLLARVAGSKSPIPLRELSEELADFHRGGILAKALRSLTNHVLIVLAYDAKSGDLVAGLWPPVRRKLDDPGGAATPPACCKEPQESFAHPFFLDDLSAVVLAATAEPLPVKQGKMLELYSAKAKELTRTLTPVPAWVCEGLYQIASRVQVAVGAASALGLITFKTKNSLSAGTEGSRWLKLDTPERFRAILDKLMARRWKKGWHNSNWNFSQACGKFRTSRLNSDIIPLEDGLSKAFLQLPEDGSPMPLQEFLEFASEHHNPLFSAVGCEGFLLVAVPGTYGGWDWKKRETATLGPEVLGELRTFLETRLVPLGAVRLGNAAGRTTISLTGIGRYYLGAARTLEIPREPEAGRVVVQPNFEIIFLGPNLRAEAELGAFSERTGSGTGALFRLTKASVQSALHRGFEVEQITGTLRNTTGRELPKNVAAELSAWAAARQTYSIRSMEVLECASPEAALHVHALVPHGTKSLGGSFLEVVRPLKGPDKNRLEKAGFYRKTR